ncbi:hypothetical protein Tco_1241589 [Tanacetum coccineum]
MTHTIGGVFLNPEDKALYDEMLRLYGLGSNTPMGVPYTKDEIMAIVHRGKQRGHIPGVGRILPRQGTDCIVIYLQVKLTILLTCLYCQASTPLILGQIDMLVLTAIFDTFDVSLLLLMSDLDHFFDAYHPSWVPSNTSN